MPQNSGSRNLAGASRKNETLLLDAVEIQYGPPAILGRFFLEADKAARARGVRLTVGDFDDLVEVNVQQAANWISMIPLFNPTYGSLTADNAFCVFARSATSGDIVATHAVRCYDWSTTNFKIEAESLRLLYSDPASMKLPNESCEVTAPAAVEAVGNIVYSGAAWCRPDWRGRGLSAILPRVAKAWAYTTWDCDKIVSVMTRETHARGFAPRFGYTTVDWDVRMRDSRVGNLDFAYLAMERRCLVDYLQRLVALDRRPLNRLDGQRTA